MTKLIGIVFLTWSNSTLSLCSQFWKGNAHLTNIPTGLDPKIRSITLSNNLIQSIPNFIFANLSICFFLNLQQNQISRIERNSFEGLVSLRHLNLAHNMISVVHDQAFASPRRLRILYLQHNKISLVNCSTFESLYNLQTLVLNDNEITAIHEHTFASLQMLSFLQLDHNNLSCISFNLFGNLTSVRNLKLECNKIQSLKLFPLQCSLHSSVNLTDISEFDMKIDKHAVCLPTKMKLFKKLQIKVQDNQILVVPNYVFRTFENCEEIYMLNLERNNIKEMMIYAFHGLFGLYHLRLQENSIDEILNGTFITLVKLITLRLDKNRISHLNENTFKGLVSLQQLNLSSNRISHIAPGSLHFWTMMKNQGSNTTTLRKKLTISEWKDKIDKRLFVLDLNHSFILQWKIFMNMNNTLNSSDTFFELPSKFLQLDHQRFLFTCGRHLCWLQQISWQIFSHRVSLDKCEKYLTTVCPNKGKYFCCCVSYEKYISWS